MPTAELPACVFCGEPIGPGEETAGRVSAHAACADAALTDDAHWDAIDASGGAPPEEAQPEHSGGARRAGCLTLVSAAAFVLGLAVVLPT